MNRNQFFYTVFHQTGTEEVPETTKTMASFNIQKVIRSMEISSGDLIVILDDFHEEIQQQNTVNPNTNKVIIGKKEKVILQSEIRLSVEDKERFFNQTNIEE